MATWSISDISVSALLCPLIETKGNKRKTLFANGVYSVWKTATAPSPAVISEVGASLNATLNVNGAVPTGTIVSVSATYVMPNGAIRTLVSTQNIPWDPARPVVNCPITGPQNSGGATRPTPWTFKGQCKWTIKSGTQSSTQNTEMELYVLPPTIPKYLIDNGIPLQLLRLENILPAWMALDDPANNDWSAFVVKALFNDTRLWYDTFIGATTYSSWDSTTKAPTYSVNGPKLQCWMELWLSDMYGLAGSASSTKKLARYPVNCQDTATLVHAIASLGTVGGSNRWRMIYMEPYGFINSTHLIGRYAGPVANFAADWCNNPFYKTHPPWNAAMSCPRDDVTRSSFANHYYMQLNDTTGTGEKVYDACAGPEVGTKDLAKYIADSVDTYSTLYSPNTYPGGQLRPAGPGTVLNCLKGPGVVNYAAAVNFTRTKPTVPTTTPSLFDRMDTTLSANGVLKSPFEGSAAGNNSIVATWTFAPATAPTQECQVSIWRYKYENDAASAFNKRLNDLTLYTKDPLRNDVYYMDPQTQYRMLQLSVASGTNDNNFLIVVEGTMTNAAVDTYVVQPMKTGVFNKPLDDNTFITQVDTPVGNVSLNHIFEITIRPSAITRTWWRGYKVNSHEGDVLLMDSTVDGNENIKLELLARRPGPEKLSVTVYGPNLDRADREINLNIV